MKLRDGEPVFTKGFIVFVVFIAFPCLLTVLRESRIKANEIRGLLVVNKSYRFGTGSTFSQQSTEIAVRHVLCPDRDTNSQSAICRLLFARGFNCDSTPAPGIRIGGKSSQHHQSVPRATGEPTCCFTAPPTSSKRLRR